MSIRSQNLEVDMPASTRITSRSSKGPAGPPLTSSTPAVQRGPTQLDARPADLDQLTDDERTTITNVIDALITKAKLRLITGLSLIHI